MRSGVIPIRHGFGMKQKDTKYCQIQITFSSLQDTDHRRFLLYNSKTIELESKPSDLNRTVANLTAANQGAKESVWEREKERGRVVSLGHNCITEIHHLMFCSFFWQHHYILLLL